MQQEYFAALDKDRIGGELQNRVDSFYKFIQSAGILPRYRKSWLSYYGCNAEKSSYQVHSSGEQGELSVLVSNEYRNLVNHLLVLTTQSRPAMDCIAANSDYDSQVQCILGNNLLEYYLRESKLEKRLKEVTEISLVLDHGFLMATWDTQLGSEVAVDYTLQPPRTIRNGDISYKALTPLDVVYDYAKRSADEHDWYIVREYKNKFDLAAQYPDQASEIISLSRNQQNEATYRFDNWFFFAPTESADIPVYTFFHKRSPALPKGRLLQFCSPKVILFDGPIPYRKLPVVRIAPSEMISKSFGWTPATDLMGWQDVIDSLVSAITTNCTAFGVSNIWAPPGHNLEINEIASGMNLFESKVKPEPLNFAQFPPQLLQFLQFGIGRQETLSGVNAVARGNPPNADMSGSALALIQSMALQFNSGLQQAYAELISDIGQLTINHLQDFATEPRIVQIAGKFQRYQTQSFTGADLSDIQRVHVDMGNPLSKTVSGRMTLAQDLLKNGLIKNAEEYLQVMSTGKLDPLIEGEQALLLSIRQENEALGEGEQVPVIAIEHHELHIPAHYTVLASPSAKKDPKLVQGVLGHIQEHMNQWRQLDPQLAQVLGIPPMPPAPPMPMGPPGMGAPPPANMPPPPGAPGPGGPPPGMHMVGPHPAKNPVHNGPPRPQGTVPQTAPNPAQIINNQSPLQKAADKARLPSAPRNPLTGKPWTPDGGPS